MNRSIALHPVLLALVGLPLALAACTSERPSPEPLGAAPAPISGKKVRQVSVRSPYGNVAATGNLVLDGDLELEQAALGVWSSFNPDFTFAVLTFQTGGQCRSGLNCGGVQAGALLFQNYVAIVPGSAGTFTFAAKPASGACNDVHGELDLGQDIIGVVLDAFVAQPDSASPGSDGWCTYTAHYTAERPLYQYAGLAFWSASDTVFDDAVVVEDLKMREIAQRERRAGDPETGRKLAGARRAVWEARQRKAPENLTAMRRLAGRTAAR